jgi:hypothetical protein
MYHDHHNRQQPLLETLTGNRWSATELPLPGDAHNRPGTGQFPQVVDLDGGIGCSPDGTCVAAGYYDRDYSTDNFGAGLLEARSEHGKNKGHWVATRTPQPANNVGDLPPISGVGCRDDDTCVAVGNYQATDAVHGLLETWHDGSWTAMATPHPSEAPSNSSYDVSGLSGVACTHSTCLSAGSYSDYYTIEHPLLVTLTGQTWTAYTPPIPANNRRQPPGGTALTSIGCSQTATCAAEGSYYDESGHQVELLETSVSGGPWAVNEAPVPHNSATNPYTSLHGTACGTSTCVTAGLYVGHGRDAQGNRKTHPLLEVMRTRR